MKLPYITVQTAFQRDVTKFDQTLPHEAAHWLNYENKDFSWQWFTDFPVSLKDLERMNKNSRCGFTSDYGASGYNPNTKNERVLVKEPIYPVAFCREHLTVEVSSEFKDMVKQFELICEAFDELSPALRSVITRISINPQSSHPGVFHHMVHKDDEWIFDIVCEDIATNVAELYAAAQVPWYREKTVKALHCPYNPIKRRKLESLTEGGFITDTMRNHLLDPNTLRIFS